MLVDGAPGELEPGGGVGHHDAGDVADGRAVAPPAGGHVPAAHEGASADENVAAPGEGTHEGDIRRVEATQRPVAAPGGGLDPPCPGLPFRDYRVEHPGEPSDEHRRFAAAARGIDPLERVTAL